MTYHRSKTLFFDNIQFTNFYRNFQKVECFPVFIIKPGHPTIKTIIIGVYNAILSISIISISGQLFVYIIYFLNTFIFPAEYLGLYFLIPKYFSSVIVTWLTLAAFISYICLLVDKRKKRYYLYCPYIFITAILCTLSVCLIITSFVCALGLAINPSKFPAIDPPDPDLRSLAIYACVYTGFYCLIGLVIQSYFLRIVIKASRYLRNVHLNPVTDLPRI